MAKIQDNTNKIKPRISSCFLGCFGFSPKISKKKISHDVTKPGTRKNARWLSLSRFRTKKSIGKTVPIDTTVSENISKSREIHMFNSDEIVPVSSQDQNVNEKPRKKKYEEFQHMVLEARKSSDSVKGDTCQKELSSTRKKEAKRAGPSHPCSPDNRSKVGVSIKKLSHSVSLTKPRPKRDVCAGKLDPVVGMSIIMVTLIIMVLWGKLCAILCTSAWFYFVPRLRKSVERKVITAKNELISGVDVNSVEYKKKVVLEGLLQRKHRNLVGFS